MVKDTMIRFSVKYNDKNHIVNKMAINCNYDIIIHVSDSSTDKLSALGVSVKDPRI